MSQRTIHSKHLFENKEIPSNYFPPIIVADSLKTPENLGNIIRLAENVRSNKVLFVDTDTNIRLSKIKKTASSSYSSVSWEFCRWDELSSKIPEEYEWIAIETSSDSANIYKCELPSKIAFFVGNEINGIRNEILDKCKRIVHIPILGDNTSLNVSHALAVALFEWQRQMFNKSV